MDHSLEAYLARQEGEIETQQKEEVSGQMKQDLLTNGETQAERVWNLMSGHYNLNRYRPPEADVVKNEWDEDPECVRLFDQIWNMSNEFMNEETAEGLRNCVYDLTKVLAIKMFEYREILKSTPLEPDRIVYELMAAVRGPEDYGWDDAGTIEDLYETPELKKWTNQFDAAWQRLEERLKVAEPETDPDVLAFIEAHEKMLELFSRQAFRYGQIFRI